MRHRDGGPQKRFADLGLENTYATLSHWAGVISAASRRYIDVRSVDSAVLSEDEQQLMNLLISKQRADGECHCAEIQAMVVQDALAEVFAGARALTTQCARRGLYVDRRADVLRPALPVNSRAASRLRVVKGGEPSTA